MRYGTCGRYGKLSYSHYFYCLYYVNWYGGHCINLHQTRKKNEEEAEKIIANALVLFLIIGVGLTIFGLIFLEPILSIFGASAELMPMASDYLRIILIGSTFLALGTGLNNFIRGEGNPKAAMNTMLYNVHACQDTKTEILSYNLLLFF